MSQLFHSMIHQVMWYFWVFIVNPFFPEEFWYVARSIRGFMKNLFEYYFLNIVVNVNFFSNLKFEYYCDYYPEILLQVSLK